MIGNQIRQIELRTGVHTYCDLGDSDRTLLLLHGFSFRQGLYPLMEALQPGFRVIAPDLPFVTNQKFRNEHTLENYVDLLMEFVQILDLKDVSIFGNSVGGTLGLMCCMVNPLRFDKLIVRCPLWSSKQLPSYLRIKPLVNLHGYLSESKFFALKMLALFYRMSARMSPTEGNPITEKNANRLQSLVPYKDDQIDPVVLSRFLGHLIQVEIENQMSTVQNSTLILWGKQDMFISSEWAGRLNQLLPVSKSMSLVGEYHNIATTDPKILATIIDGFVSKCVASVDSGENSVR